MSGIDMDYARQGHPQRGREGWRNDVQPGIEVECGNNQHGQGRSQVWSARENYNKVLT
jgi:hypothetical protein